MLAAAASMQGCDRAPAQPPAQASAGDPAQPAYQPVTVRHKLGTTVSDRLPQRVVALDMNEVDFLDQLKVPVAGMPKDFVPDFLAAYKDAADIQDVGSIVQPNLERVHAARPDLILITSLQANHYKELSEIAPTIHFDVDYRDSQARHIDVVKDHLITLGQIFGRQDLARQKAAELDARVEEARRVIQDRPEKALVVLHNNGAFSSFGLQSRYGFVFNALGVKPAGPAGETGLHGQPVSSEFIQQASPDVIYLVDRTAVMEHKPVMDAEGLANPLLRQTPAWKNDRMVFADAQAWYVTAASPTSLRLVIDDVLKGYRR
jgi:iron complex transport system substrate-binding protein